jgi:hypothetical protein
MNLTVELTTDQVVGFVQQMPPEEKRAVLLAIAEKAEASRVERMNKAYTQFRQLCATRGLNWDTMTEMERENFVDDLMHEDRECKL